MNNNVILIIATVVCAQLSGCSTLKDYISPPKAKESPPIIQSYNFIKPRYTELPQSVLANLSNRTSSRFEYFSASGRTCRTLSVTPLAAACNINGKWKAGAPIFAGSK